MEIQEIQQLKVGDEVTISKYNYGDKYNKRIVTITRIGKTFIETDFPPFNNKIKFNHYGVEKVSNNRFIHLWRINSIATEEIKQEIKMLSDINNIIYFFKCFSEKVYSIKFDQEEIKKYKEFINIIKCNEGYKEWDANRKWWFNILCYKRS